MKIPYNRVHVRGDVLFAARCGRIHSFSLHDGSHLSTWRHPDCEAQCDANPEPTPAGDGQGAEGREPPAKRQRRETGEDPVAPEGDAAAAAAAAADPPGPGPDDDGGAQAGREASNGQQAGQRKAKGGGKAKAGKPERHQGRPLARAPDRAVITQVTSTADGRHVVAVSGHDKALWVFAHDGRGALAQLSQRTMPKRPSAVAISAVDSRIVCADKFGDVYALPLLAAPAPPAAANPPAPAPAAAGSSSSSRPGAPAASTLTVHSKRNREALKNQERQLALARQRGDAAAAAADRADAAAPAFELTLLLGHVSMLTALVLAERGDGRRYILTADRDEHIRVSRCAPHAHVIEAFCLGHGDFVSALALAPARGADVLVSGGGDDDLLVWDWSAGALLSRAGVLALARQVAPATARVAVSALHSFAWPSESGDGSLTYVLAICEGVQAVFSWQLTDTGTLIRPSAIQLPAAPLHLSVVPPSSAAGAPPTLVIAADPGPGPSPAPSLQAFRLAVTDGRLAVGSDFAFRDGALEAAGEVEDASPEEIHRLLYTVENLRKQAGAGEDEDSAGAVGAAGEDADSVGAAGAAGEAVAQEAGDGMD